jgi:hypothetical protein
VTPKSVGRRRYFVTHVRRTHQWLVPSCTNLPRFGRRFDAKLTPTIVLTDVLPCRWTPFQGFRFIYNIADDFRPRIRKNTGLGDVNFYSEGSLNAILFCYGAQLYHFATSTHSVLEEKFAPHLFVLLLINIAFTRIFKRVLFQQFF